MRKRFHHFCQFLLPGLILAMVSSFSQAQNTLSPEVWQKDIVVLVDVSASVDPNASTDARDIIEELVMARFDLDLWKDRGWTVKEANTEYFSRILDGTDGATPLMREGKFLLVMQIGNIETVKANYYPRYVTQFPGDFTDYLRITYPTQMRDGWTHYILAQAYAYERMSEKANNEGYYLFVVSDAEDDPGPDKQNPYDKDDTFYIERWKRERANDETVAILDYDVSRSRKKMARFQILIKAIGFDPNEKPPAQVIEEPPAIVEQEPLKPEIQWLGGLGTTDERNPKVFKDASPFIAWQTYHLPDNQKNFEVRIRGANIDTFRSEAPKEKMATRLKLPTLENGDYTIEVRTPPDSPVIETKAFIRVEQEKSYTLVIAIISGVLSIGIFFYAWWALRQASSS